MLVYSSPIVRSNINSRIKRSIIVAEHLRFMPAASFPLVDFADLFTRTFEGYWYPGSITVQQLSARARIEQLDFSYSPVMLLNDEPVGQALLGLRAARA